MGWIRNLLWGDDDDKNQKDIDDIMHMAFDPEESAHFDAWDEMGMIPHSQYGDDEDEEEDDEDLDDGEINTPPWHDRDDEDNRGWRWLPWNW